MSYSAQLYPCSSDYHFSDQEASQRYQQWKADREAELRQARAKFAPESIPKMANRLFSSTHPDKLEIERVETIGRIIMCYSIGLFVCIIAAFCVHSLTAITLIVDLAILSLVLALLYYYHCRQTFLLRAYEYYVWLALGHFYNALDEERFFWFETYASDDTRRKKVSAYEEALSRLMPQYNLSQWDRHLLHDYSGPAKFIVQYNWHKLVKGTCRHPSEADLVLRDKLLHLADLWYLGLRDQLDFHDAKSWSSKATRERLEVEALYHGALLSGNLEDSEYFSLQLQACRKNEAELSEFAQLCQEDTLTYLEPYLKLVKEIESLASQIADSKQPAATERHY